MLKPVILIAEGDSTLRQSLRRQLVNQGYDLIEAGNRAATFQAVRDSNPDLVILGGWGKDEWDAIQTAKDIRGWSKKVLLILMIRHSSEDIAFAALRAGIDDYLKSPFRSMNCLLV
jgi:DNA-binding response OmpR family regulator